MNGTQSESDQTAYCYIITRRDLGLSYAAVQAAHAAYEAGNAFYSLSADHPHFCVCAVKDERRLLHDLAKIKRLGVKVIEWRESDLNDELTAIATEPIKGELRRHFRNFQLLKEEVANVAD